MLGTLLIYKIFLNLCFEAALNDIRTDKVLLSMLLLLLFVMYICALGSNHKSGHYKSF